MSDEQIPINKTSDNIAIPSGEWAMPEPVFRSSEGRTPGTNKGVIQDDIPTEPGFSEKTEEDISTAKTEELVNAQSVRAATKIKVRRPKKSGGCAKTFGIAALLIGLLVGVVLFALIYFLFIYSPTQTTF